MALKLNVKRINTRIKNDKKKGLEPKFSKESDFISINSFLIKITYRHTTGRIGSQIHKSVILRYFIRFYDDCFTNDNDSCLY